MCQLKRKFWRVYTTARLINYYPALVRIKKLYIYSNPYIICVHNVPYVLVKLNLRYYFDRSECVYSLNKYGRAFNLLYKTFMKRNTFSKYISFCSSNLYRNLFEIFSKTNHICWYIKWNLRCIFVCVTL